MSRSCDGCTKCCEGYLEAEINGYLVNKDNPCRYICVEGCSIHDTKPETPCKTYTCLWILDESIPVDFKPNISNIIISTGHAQGHDYIMLTQAGNTVNYDVVTYYTNKFYNKEVKNLLYEINGESVNLTTPILL